VIGNTAHVDNSETPVGFDVSLVEPWLAAHTRVVPPCRWTRLTGGHSNLTYLLADSNGAEFVIRRPPQGDLLPKAHDMFREYRIIEALHPVGIPVAEPVGYCDDRAVCDRHFYVMAKVGGSALYNGTDTAQHLDLAARGRVGESFMSVLASIHSVDPADVGLGELGRPDGYVGRQLRTWYGSWTASAEAADYDDPRVHELHEWLLDKMPEQGPGRVVHGDYGVHNSMVSSDGKIVAILDWEIATLGDPLADFAYALNAWAEPTDPHAALGDAATAIEGFSSRDELTSFYADKTGADLSNLPYYRSFNSFKTACIIHGVYARYVRGQKSTEGVDLQGLYDRIGASIELSAAHAADT
jgi:aminoglycoside phosphotransferase (APT) family kinase protein